MSRTDGMEQRQGRWPQLAPWDSPRGGWQPESANEEAVAVGEAWAAQLGPEAMPAGAAARLREQLVESGRPAATSSRPPMSWVRWAAAVALFAGLAATMQGDLAMAHDDWAVSAIAEHAVPREQWEPFSELARLELWVEARAGRALEEWFPGAVEESQGGLTVAGWRAFEVDGEPRISFRLTLGDTPITMILGGVDPETAAASPHQIQPTAVDGVYVLGWVHHGRRHALVAATAADCAAGCYFCHPPGSVG